MSGYYVYVIGPDGHIRHRISIVCDDDDEAKRQAEKMVNGHAVELWQQARWIALFEPQE